MTSMSESELKRDGENEETRAILRDRGVSELESVALRLRFGETAVGVAIGETRVTAGELAAGDASSDPGAGGI